MVTVSQSGCLGSEGGDGDIVFDNVDYGSDCIVIAIMVLMVIAI